MNNREIIELINEKIAYIEKCENTLKAVRNDSATSTLGDSLCYAENEAIEDAICLLSSIRLDGGTGSGNWGHVGVPGKWGGSAPGGGNAFRMIDLKTGDYSSKAKIQEAIRKGLKDPSPKIRAQAQLDKQRTNMDRKSARWLTNTGEFDANASKNILADVNGRGKSVQHSKKQMTREARNNTYVNMKGKGIKGAQTKQQTAQQAQQPKQAQQPQQAQQPKQAQQKAQQQKQAQQAQQAQPTAPSDPKTTTTRSTNADYAKVQALTTPQDRSNFNMNIIKNTKLSQADRHSFEGGNKMQKLINAYGITEKPTVVSAKEFQQLVKDGGQVIYRTTSVQNLNDFINSNTNRMGGTAHGAGIYTAQDAKEYKPYGNGNVQARMVIKPDAKIMTIDESKVGTATTKMNADALAQGYDGVRILGGNGSYSKSNHGKKDYVLLFNRNAVAIQDPNDGGFSKTGW